MFFEGSRYQSVPTLEWTGPDGRVVRYKAVRRLPTPAGVAKHVVGEGERLDHIAFAHLRDPERFWALCDANLAVRPDDLTATPGTVLDVPQGGS